MEGFYKNGKIELAERPNDVDESTRVLGTFLPGSRSAQARDESEDRETLRQQAFVALQNSEQRKIFSRFFFA